MHSHLFRGGHAGSRSCKLQRSDESYPGGLYERRLPGKWLHCQAGFPFLAPQRTGGLRCAGAGMLLVTEVWRPKVERGCGCGCCRRQVGILCVCVLGSSRRRSDTWSIQPYFSDCRRGSVSVGWLDPHACLPAVSGRALIDAAGSVAGANSRATPLGCLARAPTARHLCCAQSPGDFHLVQ